MPQRSLRHEHRTTAAAPKASCPLSKPGRPAMVGGPLHDPMLTRNIRNRKNPTPRPHLFLTLSRTQVDARLWPFVLTAFMRRHHQYSTCGAGRWILRNCSSGARFPSPRVAAMRSLSLSNPAITTNQSSRDSYNPPLLNLMKTGQMEFQVSAVYKPKQLKNLS